MWFSLIAYVIQAASHLGLIETEPKCSQRRAYLLAHEAMYWLRSLLSESTLLEVEPHRCRLRKAGLVNTVCFAEGRVYLQEPRKQNSLPNSLSFDPGLVDEIELGPGSLVTFTYEQGRLRVEVEVKSELVGETKNYRLAIDYLLALESG